MGLSSNNTTSLAGGQKRKHSTPAKSPRPKSPFEAILARIKPERLLRVKRVRPSTLVLYDSFVQQFVEWSKRVKCSLGTLQTVDRAMAIYFHMLFEDGAPMTTASYTLFGWITLKTVPRCPERDLLPLARAALTAWRGVKISKARVGMPPQVVYAFAAFCVESDQVWAAAAVLLQYDLYARPSEILNVSGRDLVPPVRPLCLSWGVVFGSADFSEVTKTGCSDDVVLANSSHRVYAHRILEKLGKQFLHQDVKFFKATLAQYEELFRRFSRLRKLKPGMFTPHCIRHSGPSFDAIHELRSLQTIQSRGRWACLASVNRYKKPGRLLLEASRLPMSLRTHPESVAHDTLSCILSHKWD